MSHDQLARVFPDGKTVHVPSDGRPLARYAQALSDVSRRGGSLPAASSTDSDKPKRGFLAKLFGFTEPDEDADDQVDNRAPAQPARVAASNPAPQTKLASVIPLPLARPNRQNHAVAAAAPIAPVDVINSRGTWTPAAEATATQPAATYASGHHAAAALGSSKHRFVWSVGPQGHPRSPEPSHPVEPRVQVADASPETTNIGPWSVPARSDRVAPEVALAYAAASGEATVGSRSAVIAMRAEPRPPTPPTPTTPSRAVSAAPGQRIDNPWLRGVVVSPSVQHTMSVAVLGPTDYRTLTPLMRKPNAAVAMVFSDDPLYGLAADAFSGVAVSFIPTVTFLRSHTAGLN
jgi:hypothetical protein